METEIKTSIYLILNLFNSPYPYYPLTLNLQVIKLRSQSGIEGLRNVEKEIQTRVFRLKITR